MLSKVMVLALAVGVVVGQMTPVLVPASGSVTFQSPGYPNGYEHGLDVSFDIAGQSGGNGLQFDAEYFDTESNYDRLTFREQINGAFVDIGSFSGGSGPVKFRSATNHVSANFVTDGSINGTGFKIVVKQAVCRVGTSGCPGNETICIASSQYCDGHQDCPSNADEAYCPEPGTCGAQAIRPDLSAGGFKRLISSMAKKPTGKIVGGTEAVPHSWPWQIIMLTASGSHLCGGSIINNNWIVTAAHCCVAYSPVPASYKVRVGAHNYQANEPSAATLTLSKVIVHPQYNPYAYDICLLKVAEPIVFSREVSPVCLPTKTHDDGAKCWVTGWGNTGANRMSFAQHVSNIKAQEAGFKQSKAPKAEIRLRQVDVNIVNQEECNTAYTGQISPDMICGAAPGKDSCQGDSGGPFVCENEGQYELVGVVSWGYGCARPGYPGVYARTSEALDWINESVANN